MCVDPGVCHLSQGRARPSIAKLYSWRYQDLGDLPAVQQQPQFLRANPGFAFDYQFINVPDFMGKVEARLSLYTNGVPTQPGASPG